MKKHQVWLLVGLMTVALVGLVSFQVYWINKTIVLNKEAFDDNVINTLKQVTTNLERREAAMLTSNTVMSFYTFRDSIDDESEDFVEGRRKKLKRNEIIIEHDTVRRFEIKTLNEVTLLDKTTVVTPGGEREIIRPANVDTLHRRWLNKESLVNVIIEQLTTPNQIADRIKGQDLDSLLNYQLASNGIDIAFDYVVYNYKLDTAITGRYSRLTPLKNSELKAALFPSDVFNSGNYILVNFPTQASYLLKQIWGTLVVSILFIIIIVSCFYYAIYVILKQKKVSEVKNDFINNMTHELKTPIATVGLAVEALGEKEIRDNQSTVMRYLSMIKEENQRLANQVDKVLQSALLEKETFIINKEQLSLHDIISRAVEKQTIQLDEAEGKLTMSLNATEDLILADEHHLTNVLVNIIDNAIKYAKDSPQIDIKTYNETNTVNVEIMDKGIGMSSQTLQHIFDKFYRAHTGNRHDVKGFGLGLSYVKIIMERHGGEVSAISTLNVGTTFKLTFGNGSKN